MSVLPIRTIGDPVLRTRAEEVTAFDDALRRLVADMHETMLDVGGVGLAAPQVGVSVRLFTWAVEGSAGHVVNPVLEVGEEPQEGGEGCLSVPGLAYDTPRRNWARVTGLDRVALRRRNLVHRFPHRTAVATTIEPIVIAPALTTLFAATVRAVWSLVTVVVRKA